MFEVLEGIKEKMVRWENSLWKEGAVITENANLEVLTGQREAKSEEIDYYVAAALEGAR